MKEAASRNAELSFSGLGPQLLVIARVSGLDGILPIVRD